MGYIEEVIKLGKIQVVRDRERGKASISMISVKHDGVCGIFNGKECDCNPNITMQEV